MAAPETARVLPDRPDAPAGAAHERRLPVEEALETLLPEGSIRRGTVVAVSGHGSMTLAVALAAEASRRGSWVAAVGMADLGVAALAERGVDLERWALIDLSGRGRDRGTAADVLGAVVGGFDLVLVGPEVRVGGATARRLLARMREHGTSLICALGGGASGDISNGLQPEFVKGSGICPVADELPVRGRTARWWPGVLPVGQLVSGVTPLPAVAWVRRMLSPAVMTTWAWWRSRSTVALAMVLGMSSSNPAG